MFKTKFFNQKIDHNNFINKKYIFTLENQINEFLENEASSIKNIIDIKFITEENMAIIIYETK
ncbi:hypothetical protein O8C96_04520 [Aliarcobacter butzleri]|uniref:hypothetical protein n=1 Tax=Aliarcobacter butzleri TaxID=28197 RepID=UPI00263D0552|nr:hypothetical protein [Aliarcobacter butzleri]MDN5044986.1 hypothetical protein [Aliarcobacter butzleri]